MTMETNDRAAGRKWVSLRVVVILLGLLGIICASVIVVDRLSVRDRGRGNATNGADITTKHGSGDGSR